MNEEAIRAVARHFSLPWETEDGPSLKWGRRRIALDVVDLPGGPGPRARLREDKVALRVLRDLESAPALEGKSIVFTLGAPIKLPNQLVAALSELFRARLRSERDERVNILGNRVRYRLVKSKRPVRVLGFVFTGDPAPAALAAAVSALQRAAKKSAGERWLVLTSAAWIADPKTWQRTCSRVGLGRFGKILLVDGRRVHDLRETSGAAPHFL
jgi:hypothetical protein